MEFVNEFLNVVDGATSQVEDLYQSRLKKFTDELTELNTRLANLVKQVSDKKKLIAAINKSGQGGVVKEKIQNEINSLNGVIYQLEKVSIPSKQKEINDLKNEFSYLPSQQSNEITAAAVSSANLSKEEYDQLLKTQIEIEQQKKESQKVKIFMGVGVGLVTLLILFKTIK